MRLVRFLAAGKSLVGSKDLTGRYRLPQGRSLPKFGSGRPPTLHSTVEAVAAADQVGEEPAPVANAEPDAAQRREVHAPAGQAEDSAHSMPYPRLASPVVQPRSIFRRLLSWLPWLRATSGQGPIPAFSKVPVQTELSLENVKVVRNDLSESDLEVQPVRPVSAPPNAPAPAVRGLENPAVSAPAAPTGGEGNDPN